MKINIESEPIKEARLLCNTEAEVPVEGDYVIPDYRSEVFRVLKAVGEPVILQRLISGPKLAVEGYVKLTVLYSSGEDGAVHSVFHKLPFSKQLELKASAAEPCRVMARGEMAYLNCRAVNSRRLDMRGAVKLHVQVLDTAEERCCADINGPGIQQQVGAVSYIDPVMLAEKRFSLNETLETEHPIAGESSIISCRRAMHIDSAERSAGDVIISGSVDIDLNTADENGNLHRSAYHIPFRQLIECENAENSDISVWGDVVSTGFQGDDSGSNMLDISLGCSVSCLVYCRKEAELVLDAFSTRYETNCSRKAVPFVKNILSPDVFFDTEADIGTETDSSAEVIDAFAVFSSPEIKTGTAAEVVITGHLVCIVRDTEGVKALETPFEETVSLGRALDEAAFELNVSGEVSSRKTGNGIKLHLKGRVWGQLIELSKQELVRDVSVLEDKPKPKSEYALVMSYGDVSQDHWELAKQYNTSPEAIAAENPDPLADGPLLIPISD